MRITIVVALVLLTIACSTSEQPTTITPLPTSNEVRILALGDSYTIGQSVSEADRWPDQLADAVGAHNIDVIDITYVAKTGWTTTDLQTAIDEWHAGRNSDPEPYDLVSLLIGVNNQVAGMELARYEQEFTDLLEEAIGFGADRPGRVFVLSIPDYGVTPVGGSYGSERIRMEIDAHNAVNRRIAADYGVHYVDITPISRMAADDPSLIARDGLHPSGAMYAEWVSLMLPMVVDALQGDPLTTPHSTW